jgi:uncharacterized protein YceK
MRLVALLIVLSGCASTTQEPAASENGVDRARMATVESQAARSGVRVFWVNPPLKASTSP